MEEKMVGILAATNEAMGSTARDNIDPGNRFTIMVRAGSKGSDINVAQMISALGQQQVEGKRIPYGYDDRTLPHYAKFDDGMEARGFIQSSFIQGLKPTEFFFHAVAGRIGLIDTAVKTSTTGYIQRRLIKVMEDLVVAYDGTVRNSKSKVMQFRYGGDNIDPCKVEEMVFPLCEMSIEQVYGHFNMAGIAYDDAVDGRTSAAQRSFAQLEECNALCREWTLRYVDYRDLVIKNVFRNDFNNVIRVPVGFPHLVAATALQFKRGADSKVDVTPLEVFQLLDTYYGYLRNVGKNFEPSELFKIAYYFFLSPRELLAKRRFSKEALVFLLERVLLQYKKALVEPGENVGIIAAQSIGQPTTQLTLNTFHHTGGKNETEGTPRVEEILSITSNMKNPSLTVYLKVPTKENAHQIRSFFPHTVLRDVVKSMQLYFNPPEEEAEGPDLEVVRYHREFEAMAEKAEEFAAEKPVFSPWVVRFEFDRTELFEKDITMDDVYFAFKYNYESDLGIVFADYNADVLVFRVRLSLDLAKKKIKKTLDEEDQFHKITQFEDELLNMTLRGIKGIDKASVRCVKNKVGLVGDAYTRRDEYVIDTQGSNLLAVLGMPFVDAEKTVSNDIREVAAVLGIDAAAVCIYNELTAVLEPDGYINPRHKNTLIKRMTNTAKMCPVFRTGLREDDVGPIAKASFEETPEMFVRAAKWAEVDLMRGVSANKMLGQTGYYGTAAPLILLDVEALPPIVGGPKRRKAALPTEAPPSSTDVHNDLAKILAAEPTERGNFSIDL
jgi:DNA-directed RNA polymerase II subunit RPB1